MISVLENWQEKDFNDFIKSKKTGLILFSAPWCAACKLTTPIIEDLAKNNPDFPFAKIDVSKNPGLASKMGIMSLPNILLINGGKVKDQIIGSTNKKEIETKIKKLK